MPSIHTLSRSASAGRAVVVLVLTACCFALAVPGAAWAEQGWSGTIDIIGTGSTDPRVDYTHESHWVYDGVANRVDRDAQGRPVIWNQNADYVSKFKGVLVNPGPVVETWEGEGSGTYLSVQIGFDQGDPLRYFYFGPGFTGWGFPATYTHSLGNNNPDFVALPCEPDFSVVSSPASNPVAPDGYNTTVLSGSANTDGVNCHLAPLGGSMRITWNLTRLPDQDCDGIPDSQDPVDTDGPCGNDRDGDGLTNDYELATSHTDPDDKDSDDDGLSDGDEVGRGTNPNAADTDGDGLSDGVEVFRGTDPKKTDTDGDGLSDGDEVSGGTDPTNGDSDGGGVSDGVEVSRGTDPNDARDDQGGQQPCSGADRQGEVFAPTYTARVPFKHWPDADLFHFSPSVSYCFDGESSEIRNVTLFHDVESGVVPAALGVLGFELTYDPITENALPRDNHVEIQGGTFQFVFDWTVLIDKTGLKSQARKVLVGKLGKQLGKVIKKHGYGSDAFRAAIAQAQDKYAEQARAKVLKATGVLDKVLPQSVADAARSRVMDKVDEVLAQWEGYVSASLDSNAFAGLTADQIGGAIFDNLIGHFEGLLKTDFPVWLPTVDVVVSADGEVTATLGELIQIEALAISRSD